MPMITPDVAAAMNPPMRLGASIEPPAQTPAIRPIKFWTNYKEVPDADGKPIFVEEDWVEWVKLGEQNGSRTNDAVKRLKPDPARKRPASVEWAVLGPAYEAWKRGEQAPTSGTPLYAWSGCSREFADELKKHGILSVEELAEFPDHNIQKIPLQGLREYRKRARNWVEARQTNNVEAMLTERDRTIEAQAGTMAEMQQTMAAMKAQIEAMQGQMGAAASSLKANAPSPDDEFVQVSPGDVPASAPRRGRPRKGPLEE